MSLCVFSSSLFFTFDSFDFYFCARIIFRFKFSFLLVWSPPEILLRHHLVCWNEARWVKSQFCYFAKSKIEIFKKWKRKTLFQAVLDYDAKNRQELSLMAHEVRASFIWTSANISGDQVPRPKQAGLETCTIFVVLYFLVIWVWKSTQSRQPMQRPNGQWERLSIWAINSEPGYISRGLSTNYWWMCFLLGSHDFESFRDKR